MNKSSEASPGKPSDSPEEANQLEDYIVNKVKELELSLPGKQWTPSIFIYLYQNFWLPAVCLHGFVSFHEKFQAQDSDILLISRPKSGTTWLQALAFTILNRRIYPINGINDQNPHPLLSHHPQELVPKMELLMSQTTSKLRLQTINDLLETHPHRSRLLATHLPYNVLPDSIKTSGCRIVYICRNILDTVNSFWFYSHKINAASKDPVGSLNTLEDFVESVCRGEEPYGPHWDHVLGYWQESLERPNKVLFMKYEDIKGEAFSEIKRLAEFMGCPFTSDEVEGGVIEEIARFCSIQSLKELEVNKNGVSSNFGMKNSAYFRKGEVGDWKNHMSTSMVENLEKVTEQKFLGSGLTFKTT